MAENFSGDNTCAFWVDWHPAATKSQSIPNVEIHLMSSFHHYPSGHQHRQAGWTSGFSVRNRPYRITQDLPDLSNEFDTQ
jgi:hypothetical protein